MRTFVHLALPLAALLSSDPVHSRAEDVESLVARAEAETSARALTLPDGRPLCFLPVSVARGSEVHFVRAARGAELAGDDASPYGVIDLELEPMEAPVILMLGSYEPIIWRVSVAEGARLRGVHLTGDPASLVTGLPPDVPVTLRFDKDAIGTRQAADCPLPAATETNPDEPGPHRLALSSVYTPFPWFGVFWLDRMVLSDIERHLQLYADVPLRSFQQVADAREPVTVSPRSTAFYEKRRREGRAWLEALTPPDLAMLPPDAPVLDVPERLSGVEASRWIIAQSYAVRMSKALFEYVCDLDRAKMEARGIPAPRGDLTCRYGGFEGRNRIVLLGKVRVQLPSCHGGGVHVWVPAGAELQMQRNCLWLVSGMSKGGN